MHVSSSIAARTVSLVAPIIGNEEIDAVVSVLRSGQLAQGPIVAAFEREFAEAVGAKHAVAVNSGTAAIHCAMNALGIAEGDEVLTTPFTFAATATPVLMQRGVVRFVDIDSKSFNVDLNCFATYASERTKAVIGVDLFGLPFDRVGLDDLRKRGIRVFDDACQAVGASRQGKHVGADCDAAGFSFYATKNLMSGEGGMLTTNDDDIAASARRFRQHGQGERYEYHSLGYNYRLTDVLAAVGREQLKRAGTVASSRRENARYYDEHLAGVSGITTPLVPDGAQHVYHQYSILVEAESTDRKVDRDALRAALAERGVATGVYYPKPLHLHPLFGGDVRRGEFPVAERIATQIVALPIHPSLDEADLAYVVASIKAVLGGRK